MLRGFRPAVSGRRSPKLGGGILRISAPDGILSPRRRIQSQIVGRESTGASPEVAACPTVEIPAAHLGYPGLIYPAHATRRRFHISNTPVFTAWHASAGAMCRRRRVSGWMHELYITLGEEIREIGGLRIYRKISDLVRKFGKEFSLEISLW